MYRVVKYFTDKQDNNYPYSVGDEFPREGLEVSEERLKELSSTNNRRGVVLIQKKVEKKAEAEPVEEKPKPKKKTTKKKETE